MTFTFRLHIDIAVTMCDYLLDDCEAETDSFVVHLGRSKKFTEPREQLLLVLLGYTDASVAHVTNEHLSVVVVGQCNCD